MRKHNWQLMLVGSFMLAAICYLSWQPPGSLASWPPVARTYSVGQTISQSNEGQGAPIEQARQVCKVTCLDGAMASAVPIARVRDVTVFLTCAHVAKHGPTEVRDLTGNIWPVLGYEVAPEGLDAAIFWARANLRPLDLIYEMPTFGTPVFAAGWPAGLGLFITPGYVASGDDTEIEKKTSASVFYGNSGGAMLDGRGRLLGIVSRVYGDGNGMVVCHLSYLVPCRAIADWMVGALTRAYQSVSTGK